MESDAPTPGGRPRPWLLVALGIAVVALVATYFWPTASTGPSLPASNQGRPAAARRDQNKIDPSDLDLRLESLNVKRTEIDQVERNPFRFKPKPPPPPPPVVAKTAPPGPTGPVGPPQPPPPPPIALKFIGIVEKQGLKVAALSDCKITYYGREGEVIDGRYRLIRIGVESMVIEYVDGRGRTTVRLEGCPPR